MGFNNATNSLDCLINPSEKDQLHIVFNNYRINKNYDIPGSVENKIKKLYSVKETSINSKIKLIKKSQKPVPQKRQEIRTLQDELFQYGVSLNDQWPGTYYGMILSHMQSPNNEIPHLGIFSTMKPKCTVIFIIKSHYGKKSLKIRRNISWFNPKNYTCGKNSKKRTRSRQ